jgi:putative transcriptional regulator
MNNRDFNGIMAGLEDATAFVKGDRKRDRILAGPDVKAICSKTDFSPPKFAAKLHVPARGLLG